jgi:hypothetical protein
MYGFQNKGSENFNLIFLSHSVSFTFYGAATFAALTFAADIYGADFCGADICGANIIQIPIKIFLIFYQHG